MFRAMLKATALMALTASPALAGSHSGPPCHDAKGKFIICPPAASAVVKDKKGRCTVASGPKKGEPIQCP